MFPVPAACWSHIYLPLYN